MALGIDLNNAQFRQFVDFASTARANGSDSKIAQIGASGQGVDGTNPLAGRTIVAKSQWDFRGNIGRRAASRATNDSARELFRNTLIEMFGGESKIPQSVKDAMKLQDYGKGCITAMVREASAAKIGAIRSLSDSSNAGEIHDAVVLFDMSANVSEALGEEPFPIDDFEGKFSEDEEMMDAARGVMEDLDAIADQQIADRAADVANAKDNL